jgi:hypothetical protein
MNSVTNIEVARFKRDLQGREYSWEAFRIWLHDRKYNKNKQQAKEEAAKERKRLNDRVLQMLGIVPGKNGLNNKKR